MYNVLFGKYWSGIAVFLLFGFAGYVWDYRSLKDKPKFSREKKFSKMVSFTYLIGSGVVISALQIWSFMM